MEDKLQKIAKNVVLIIGILLCATVIILNLIYIANLTNDGSETINIKYYGVTNLILVLLIGIALYVISKKMEKIRLKPYIEKIVLGIVLVVYFLIQVVWIQFRDVDPTADQMLAYNAAVEIYNGNYEELEGNRYLARNPQQRTLTMALTIIFKIMHTTNYRVIQTLNALCNTMTIFGLFLILKKLGKQYNVNKSILLIISTTFMCIPMLSTFVYGDIPSLMLSIYSIYFIMNYTQKNKKRYLIASSILMLFSYMLRTNNLIFIIAIVIYLILDILKKKEAYLKKTILILTFIAISIIPNIIIQKQFEKQFNLEENGSFPVTGYLYMGMTEGSRGNGWYNDSANLAWDHLETAKQEYPNMIKERIRYFAENPIYTIRFYTMKLASMWTENTYSALWYNLSFNFEDIKRNTATQEDIMQYEQKDEVILKQEEKIRMYQKALILIIFISTVIVLIQNRKQLSNELILLVTIFIGGFLFEILWEAKSRYIIPYIVILMPVAAIKLEKLKNDNRVLTKIKKILCVEKSK